MCGIFGFVADPPKTADTTLEGLRRLEYRGYDSWGVAAVSPSQPIRVLRRVGKISRTAADELAPLQVTVTASIGHTRWATHGPPTVENAHPHLSRSGRIAVVHNGIIENARALRAVLESEGYCFQSATDTEAVAHLIERELENGDDFCTAISRALLALRGAFGLAILDERQPGRLYAVRMGSPLVVGLGINCNWVSSDANALAAHARSVIYLSDGEWAEVSASSVSTFDFHCSATAQEAEAIAVDPLVADLCGYPHYMLKEIHEQPDAIRDALRGRLVFEEAMTQFGGLSGLADLKYPGRVKILACGSSWHAGLIGRQWFEDLSRIATEAEYASEFRYRNPAIEPGTLVIAISQSGETADTLAALREAVRRGAQALGIVNVVGSTIARECSRGVYLHAGPEFGVAATKSFVNQLVVLLMLAVHLGRRRGLSVRDGLALLNALEELPSQVEKALATEAQVRSVAEQFVDSENFLCIGRGLEYPIALEAALKLKEVSYVHAEGMPAAELKHGPIALITEQTPVVVLSAQQSVSDKMCNNVEEIKARGGRIILVCSERQGGLGRSADEVITVPSSHDLVSPILSVVPTQLLAYHLAVLRGSDVDQPRNLAKSVTVE